MRIPSLRVLFCALSLAAVLLAPMVRAEETPSPAETLLKGADLVGSGPISVYTKKGSVILSLPKAAFGRPFIWYAEVVGLPAGVVSDSLEAGSLLAKLERHGDLVIVRDLNTRATKTGGEDDLPPETPPGVPDSTSFPERPIDVALTSASLSRAFGMPLELRVEQGRRSAFRAPLS